MRALQAGKINSSENLEHHLSLGDIARPRAEELKKKKYVEFHVYIPQDEYYERIKPGYELYKKHVAGSMSVKFQDFIRHALLGRAWGLRVKYGNGTD